MSDRDPRRDPAPGDVVCAETGTSHAIVTAVGGETVSVTLRTLGSEDTLRVIARKDWRALTCNMQTLAERLAALGKERAETARRLAMLDENLAFLRGAQ